MVGILRVRMNKLSANYVGNNSISESHPWSRFSFFPVAPGMPTLGPLLSERIIYM